MPSVTKKCWKCHQTFRVPEDEHADHTCPNGCYENNSSGIDYFGNEYFEGDAIVIDAERGETVLEDSLEDYLIEVLGFKFENAK